MPKLIKSDIVLAAQQNVGRGSELDAICDVRLNLILEQLFENYTWQGMIRTDLAISLTQGSNTWTVPTNYLKSKFFTVVDNNDSREVPFVGFIEIQSLGLDELGEGIPQFVAIKRFFSDTGTITLEGYVFPKPNKAYTATITYYHLPTFDRPDNEAVMAWDVKSIVDLLTNELKGLGYGIRGTGPYNPFLIDQIVIRMRRNESNLGIYPLRARLDGRLFKGTRDRNRRARWPQDVS